MKINNSRILFFASIIMMITFGSCINPENENQDAGSKESIDRDKLPEISFANDEHDFGKVNEGEKVGWYFYFTNTGGQDLLIQNASSSCGCTIPDYSKEPIPPGKEGSIKVIYNSAGRSGFDTKYVNVESNASNSNARLKLEVEVIKKSNI